MNITTSIEKIEKPWGYELIWANVKNKYVAKILFINSNARLSLQYHNEKEETLLVQEGILRVWNSENDLEYKDLGPGSIYHVKPGEVHRFGSARHLPVKLIEVSTTEIDDVVRLADDYNR